MSRPTDKEIQAEVDKATDIHREGESKLYSMTYEEGVAAGLEWALGDSDYTSPALGE